MDNASIPGSQWSSSAARRVSLLGLALFAASTSTTIVGQEVGLALIVLGGVTLWVQGRLPAARVLSLEPAALALVLSWTVSTIFAVDPRASLINMKKLPLLLIVYGFAWLIEDRKTLERIVKLLLVVGAIVATYGIAMYFLKYDLEEGYRVRATLSSTVTTAGVMLLLLTVSVSLALSRIGRKERFLFATVSFLSYVCLLLTFTRGAWLGALAALPIIALKSPSKSRSAVWGSLAVLAVVYRLSSQVEERVVSVAQFGDTSIAGRVSMWLSATSIARDHPSFGAGLMDLGPLYEVFKRADSMFSSGHMHSNYFHVLAATGILGLAAFIWFLRSVCGLLVRNYARTPASDRFLKAVCLGSLAGFCAFVFAGMFEWNFGDAEVLSTLYCLVGISCACERLNTSP
jgi:O-antigen ligase